MNLFGECQFCIESHIVPVSGAERLIIKHINNVRLNKSREYNINKLKSYVKMCPNIEKYIRTNHTILYRQLGQQHASEIDTCATYHIRKLWLNSKYGANIGTGIKCNYCGSNACEFHLTYADFTFNKCNICTREYGICGWCKEQANDNWKSKCTECYKQEMNKKKYNFMGINVSEDAIINIIESNF